MIAAVIGMIPEGLYLLTTAALALSTIRLAGRSVLLHDMKSIEALARVDVLCVDKTGTITEPGMQVAEVLCRDSVEDPPRAQALSGAGGNLRELDLLLADYAAAIEDNNATMQAIREYVTGLSQREDLGEGIGENAGSSMDQAATAPRAPLATLPFSSSRKYSAVRFSDGEYVLGAPESVMGED